MGEINQPDFLRHAMSMLGMTRGQLAVRLGVGVNTVNKWMAPAGSIEHRKLSLLAISYINDILRWEFSNCCIPTAGGIQSSKQIAKRGGGMNLRTRLLDAILDGLLGSGLVVTRQEVIEYFSDAPKSYTGVLLSNAELETSAHSPTWEKYTMRIGRGVYRIHPDALTKRLEGRNIQSSGEEYPDPTDDSDGALDHRFSALMDDPKT